jgi:hypothetical protein
MDNSLREQATLFKAKYSPFNQVLGQIKPKNIQFDACPFHGPSLKNFNKKINNISSRILVK